MYFQSTLHFLWWIDTIVEDVSCEAVFAAVKNSSQESGSDVFTTTMYDDVVRVVGRKTYHVVTVVVFGTVLKARIERFTSSSK